tara:strand:+ start:158 stop:295 length:138 start_codon:yes stop_codon:yes gene_type:complete
MGALLIIINYFGSFFSFLFNIKKLINVEHKQKKPSDNARLFDFYQ